MKKILLVILGMFLLGFALNEIAGVKFPIGSTMLHDSTSVFTVNNNVKVNGTLQANGTKIETGETIKTKIVRLPIVNLGSFNTVAHGISNVRKITSVVIVVKDDSLNYNMPLNDLYLSLGLAVGKIGYLTNTLCAYQPPSTSVNLRYDTCVFTISYTE